MARRPLATLAIMSILGLAAVGPAHPQTPGRSMVDTPHQYDGDGSMCYLGCLFMAMNDRSLGYVDLVRYTNPMMIESGDQLLGSAMERLGYEIQVDGLPGGRARNFLWLLGGSGVAGEEFASEEAAWRHLKSTIDHRQPYMVFVQQSYLAPDRTRHVQRYMPGHTWDPMPGEHWIVVVGYDEEYVYIHETTHKAPMAARQPIRQAAFRAAWDTFGCVAYRPRRVRGSQSSQRVFREVVASAPEALQDLRAIALSVGQEGRPLSQREWLYLHSCDYRRGVLADWLEESGQKEAAALYRKTVPYYGMIDRKLSATDARKLLYYLFSLEEKAAAALRP